ncbi:MAG: metalloregulator ArsR/SmtB family transcription factor, partial [Saprospiraceae bacterium]|nr:metalloregulator ArsR/SmtB family transcription factor [Saprospiraceae bacterium]
AIADPVRREIIELLSREPIPVKVIAGHFDISRPAISKHLRILDECGLVHRTRQGRQHFYHINPASLIPAFLWIEQYRDLWDERIDNFESYLNQLQQQNTSHHGSERPHPDD